MLEWIYFSIVQQVEQQGLFIVVVGVFNLIQLVFSYSMKKFEQQLGIEVWLCEGCSLWLIQVGQYLLVVVNWVLLQLDLVEECLCQFVQGECGVLCIGMECYFCYQWLLKIVLLYLVVWLDVDVDVKQKFQFGGIGVLFGYEIDLLVMFDLLLKLGLKFIFVFDYEQVLVVVCSYVLVKVDYVKLCQFSQEVLISYLVLFECLDIYNQFLLLVGIMSWCYKVIEIIDIMMQMVVSGRGVVVMLCWLVEEYVVCMDVVFVCLGVKGIFKQIYFGVCEVDIGIDYLQVFIELVCNSLLFVGNVGGVC